jgi:hypothetical protein
MAAKACGRFNDLAKLDRAFEADPSTDIPADDPAF